MALSPLHGSLATIDVSVGGESMKCAFGSFTATFIRGSSSALTFCSGNWVKERPGAIQLAISLEGFLWKGESGTNYTNPLYLITQTTPVAFILTFDTGVTLSGNGFAFQDALQMTAGGNSGHSLQLRSDGPVTSAGWAAL